MLPEAAMIEPEAPAQAEAPAPAPEVNPGTETPQEADSSPDTSEQIPDTGPDTQIQVYQDIEAKFAENPNYEMTDEEADIYLEVDQMVQSGQIKKPEPAKKPEKVEKKEEPKPEPKEEKSEEPDSVPEESPDSETEPKEEVDPKDKVDGFSETNHENLYKTMKLVGAKDINELPEKVDGLIKHMKTSGGQRGQELAALKREKDAHSQWVSDLVKGEGRALEYFDKITEGKYNLSKSTQPAEQTPKPQPVDSEDELESEFLDERLAKEVNGLKDIIKEQADEINKLKGIEEKRTREYERSTAADSWVEDIVNLVEANSDFFGGMKAPEARALGKQYWAPGAHENPVHPRFQPIHELISFASERGMPDLKSAFIVWSHESGRHAQELIQATKTGQSSVQHKPAANAFISHSQARQKTDVPAPNITEDDVKRMASGNIEDIPDEWMDENGTLIPSKVPKRYHDMAFGRLGKPRK